MTFELVDLEELGDKALQDFNQALGQAQAGAANAFEEAVSSLVTKIEFTYAVAAKLAQREPTMEGTAAIWSKMVAICDQIAAQVKQLEQEHPGSKASFDRILDLRNAAERRRELHS
ncbi:MAG: hypothetical protein HY674_11005 [Chloroflexi bacterium]|nr:hypothetical protein [Chloroflexota bacterium]